MSPLRLRRTLQRSRRRAGTLLLVLVVVLAVGAHHARPHAPAAAPVAGHAHHPADADGVAHGDPVAHATVELCLGILLVLAFLLGVHGPAFGRLLRAGWLLLAAPRPRVPLLRPRAGPAFLCVSLR